MRELLDDVDYWTAVGLEYRARYLQVAKIIAGMNPVVEQSLQDDVLNTMVLAKLLGTPPAYMQQVIDSSAEGRDETYRKAAEAVRLSVRISQAGKLLIDILKITEKGKVTEGIPLDKDYPLVGGYIQPNGAVVAADLTGPLQIIFAREPELLRTATDEGKKEGIKFALELMQSPAILLNMWTLELARRRNSLTETEDGLVMLLPTVVGGIDLKYLYRPGEILPKLSFEVKPL